MVTVFALFAAVSLLRLQSVTSNQENSCDDSKVIEEDVPSELYMLQRSAARHKPEHEALKHPGDQNSTSKGSKSERVDKLQTHGLKSKHDHQMPAVEANSSKFEKSNHHKLEKESKQQHSPKRDVKKGDLTIAPKRKSKMNDQGPEDPVETSSTTALPAAPAEGPVAEPVAEGEAVPRPATEGEAAPAAEGEAPEGARGRGNRAGTDPETGEPYNAEDDPNMEAAREHFKEVAEEIKEAKIVSCVLIAMIFVFVVVHIMHEFEIHLLPEGVMIILVGILLGLVLKYYCRSKMMYDAEYRSKIAIELLNEVFLPMLMLEAGWSVRRMDFISQLPYILNFAIVGTLISTCVIATLMYQTGQAGMHQISSWRGSFVVAALISATDPVATLATYSDLKVEPLLNIIVFGEAAINDAVAIVVFTLVNDDYYMESFDSKGAMVLFGTLKGGKTLLCSFLCGASTSFVVCMVLRAVGMHRNKKLEILVVVLGGYLSYALGEYFRVSGIICTLFNGMFMGKYAKFHLSTEGSLLTSFYISQMSTIMDAGVFLLSGVCCISLSWSGRHLGLFLMAFCCIARICSTVPCGLICNFLKWNINRSPNATEADLHILTPKYLFMIWHAGLRGGIAENLALQIGEWLDRTEGPGAKEAVRSAVFMLVAAYVVIFGGTTKLFLDKLGIPMGGEYSEDSLSKTELIHVEGQVMNWLHSKVFFPILVGAAAEHQDADAKLGMGENDVLEVLHDVCHGHRGGLMSKKEPKAAAVSKGRKTFLKSQKTSQS
mmetsp:Transcript_152079/g.265105  ORF Transcript_152079/g.265105 Transcript_152079/m.265105 type:complete len:772 (-) Transcript_152079:44-2359(-)